MDIVSTSFTLSGFTGSIARGLNQIASTASALFNATVTTQRIMSRRRLLADINAQLQASVPAVDAAASQQRLSALVSSGALLAALRLQYPLDFSSAVTLAVWTSGSGTPTNPPPSPGAGTGTSGSAADSSTGSGGNQTMFVIIGVLAAVVVVAVILVAVFVSRKKKAATSAAIGDSPSIPETTAHHHNHHHRSATAMASGRGGVTVHPHASSFGETVTAAPATRAAFQGFDECDGYAEAAPAPVNAYFDIAATATETDRDHAAADVQVGMQQQQQPEYSVPRSSSATATRTTAGRIFGGDTLSFYSNKDCEARIPATYNTLGKDGRANHFMGMSRGMDLSRSNPIYNLDFDQGTTDDAEEKELHANTQF